MDLPFRPVDGDHHYYEARDAFTRHLDPAMAKRCVQWAEIGGRQRILVGGKFDRFAEAACRFVVVDWSIRAREGRPGVSLPRTASLRGGRGRTVVDLDHVARDRPGAATRWPDPPRTGANRCG